MDLPEFSNTTGKSSWLDKLARRIVLSRLEMLESGQIIVSENGEQVALGHLSEECPLTATVCVINPKFYSEIAFGGAIGAGEAYIEGYWACANLSDLLQILIRNREVLEQVDSGLAFFAKPLRKLLHALNRNTRSGSRKNIAAHYDLGNDFYQLWLDEKMMYSSAYFATTDTTLEDAASAKLDRICKSWISQPTTL